MKNGCFLPNFEQLAKRGVEGARSEQALELHELREQRSYSIPKTYTLFTGAGKVSELARTSTKLETMKATLLALLTLGSLAMAAEGDITLSSPSGTQGQAGYTSFDFVLNSDWLVKDPTTTALTEIVSLTSITVTPAGTWYNQTQTQRNQGSGVAIYEKSENVWKFVGASNWKSGYALNSALTYDFSDALTLSSGTKYTAVFYGYKTSYEALKVGTSILNDLSGLQNPTETNPVAVYGMKSLQNAATTDFALYGGAAGTPEANYRPLVSFTVQNQNVPEPMTGTLSLLALAGLCIRRRK